MRKSPFHICIKSSFHPLLLCALCWLLPAWGKAQPGVKLMYHFQSTPSWDMASSEYFQEDLRVLPHYFGVGANYWIEHVRYNLGIAPGLLFLQSSTSRSGRDTTFNYMDKALELSVDVSFFPFHPVKPNPWLDAPPMNGRVKRWKKRLFIQSTPAVVWHHKRIDPAGEKHNGINFKIDFGLGYITPLSAHLGIAPIVKAGLQPGMKWPGFSEIHEAYDVPDRTLGAFVSFSLYLFYM